MYVRNFFNLDNYSKSLIRDMEPEFGYNGYGELVFFRTYSRIREDGGQESWHDVVIRVIEGVMSIRKDWYIKNHISWNERDWQRYARKLAIAMFKMYWMPPGRGLWAMGTKFVYERGSMALYNCLAGETTVVTRRGIYPIIQLNGVEVEVLTKTPSGYHWIKTKIGSYGNQQLMKLTLIDRTIVYATADHEWLYVNADNMAIDLNRKKRTRELIASHDIIPVYNDQYQYGKMVSAIEYTDRFETVYCCDVPQWHNFVLGNGLLSGNCSFTEINDDLSDDLGWMMDSLMLGVGVGFRPNRNDDFRLREPRGNYDFIIPDSREGWVEGTQRLLKAYQDGTARPRLIYDEIRGPGLPIRGFGGVSSGPQPLMDLHLKIEELSYRYIEDPYYDSVHLKTDLSNLIGCCVVAGNLRRSAEKANLSIKDRTFKELKNYNVFPERREWGWMSNNSVDLEDDEDFEMLGEIADKIKKNGEPGYNNLRNFPLGRLGKRDKVRRDKATGTNPCEPFFAPVLTKFGIKKFGELKVGDVIWSETGWTKVIDFWSTGINKVYRYKTTAAIFEGTSDHRIVQGGMKVDVGSAYAIDILAGPYEKIDSHDPLTMMDGLVIGDGTVSKQEVMLLIGCDDNDYFGSEIEHLIVRRMSPNSRIITTIQKEELAYTYDRKIPDRFVYGSKKTIASFLRGLYSANGSLCGQRVTLKAASIDIIEQAQLMLNSIGIRSYKTTNKSKLVDFRNGEYVCKQSYDLNINIDRKKFAESIGFIQEYKNRKLQEIIKVTGKSAKGNKNTHDITEVEYLGEEETFDCTVDNETNTYWSGGCNVSNCSEILLQSRETCNVDETCPTRCPDTETWLKACRYATFYASTVSLLPTHQPSTNRVVARNRRIGVSIIDVSGWKHQEGVNKVTKYLREGYKIVRSYNRYLNGEAGVPEAIRVTTIKPGGTVPKLVGRTAGAGYPTFEYTNRRTRVAKNSAFSKFLIENGLSYEQDVSDPYTLVFDYPIIQGPAKSAYKISVWQQAMDIVWLQREWADNSVSNTLYFRPKWVLRKIINNKEELLNYLQEKMYDRDEYYQVVSEINNCEEEIETSNLKLTVTYKSGDFVQAKIYKYDANNEEDSIESVLSMIAPDVKSISLLPHSPKGAYAQMPEEGITVEQYQEMLAKLAKIDWSKYNGGTDGVDERYCDGGACEIKVDNV